MKTTLESISQKIDMMSVNLGEIKEDIKAVRTESVDHKVSIAVLQKTIAEARDDHSQLEKDVNALGNKVRSLSSTRDKWVGYGGGALGVIGAIAWLIDHVIKK